MSVITKRRSARKQNVTRTTIQTIHKGALVTSINACPTQRIIRIKGNVRTRPFITSARFIQIRLRILRRSTSIHQRNRMPLSSTQSIFHSHCLFHKRPLRPSGTTIVRSALRLSRQLRRALRHLPILCLLQRRGLPTRHIPITLLPKTFPNNLNRGRMTNVIRMKPLIRITFGATKRRTQAIFSSIKPMFLHSRGVLLISS